MIVLLVGVFLLLAVAVPVGVAFALPSILGANALGIPPETFAASVPHETAMSFTLVAIPYFLLAGQIMQRGGLMERLIDLANSLLGWLRGALGYVMIASSAMLGAITGSSVATVATMGQTVGQSMQRQGYDRGYVGALTGASGLLGVLIPPSIPLIIYSTVAGVSVGDMFIATIVPGVLMIGAFMVVHRLMLRRALPASAEIPEGVAVGAAAVSGTSRSGGTATSSAPDGEATALGSGPGLVRQSLSRTAVRAVPALLMPVILFGGLYSGIMTPTEAAAVAALYGLIATLVLHGLGLKTLPAVFYAAALPSIAILSIVVFSSVFSRLITLERIPQAIAETATSVTTSAIVFLLLMNLVLLLVGMFMETNAAVLLMAPLFVPAALAFDLDPVHFGIILVTNIELGLLTPPLAANLYVAAKTTGAPIVSMMRSVLPFFAAALTVQLLITYVPVLTTWHLS